MKYQHQVEDSVFVLTLLGDLIGENRGPELMETGQRASE